MDDVIFAVRRYASAIYAVVVCLYVWERDKNSSEDEIANVNFLRRYGTYVLQNTKKENLLRLTN